MMKYSVFVADTEEVLAELANISGANFVIGQFSEFEDQFCDSGEDKAEYRLASEELNITVVLEKYEGYFEVILEGSGDVFMDAKTYLASNSGSNY